MRTRAKVDGNHGEVVKALRQIGVSVQDLSRVGAGCPDLLVSWRDRATMLMEVKDGSKPPSARKLTRDQEEFHAKWGGRIAIVTSPEHAVTTIINFGKELGLV